MKDFLSFMKDAKFYSVVFFAGSIFVLLGWIHVDNLQKGQFVAYGTPIYLFLIVGVILIVFALVTFVYSALDLRIAKGLTKYPDRVVAQIGENTITVVLGRLEQCISDPSQALVVLPANEYFDDKCINDTRSALGAFMQSKFHGRTRDIESLLREALEKLPSYGLGTTVFLDRPLSEPHRILLAAATTERPGEGLRGDVAALFPIVRDAHRVARDNRLSEVVLPMIGAGHGSICPDHALIVQLLAWSELLHRYPGQQLAVRVVIFRAEPAAKSEVSLKSIFRLLSIATASCAVPQGK